MSSLFIRASLAFAKFVAATTRKQFPVTVVQPKAPYRHANPPNSTECKRRKPQFSALQSHFVPPLLMPP